MSKKNRLKQKFRIPEWDCFKPGDVIEMKGAFFLIHRINPLARQIILIGIKDPRPKQGGQSEPGHQGHN